MKHTTGSRLPISPLRVFLLVLAVAFAIEGLVMLVLPLIGPWPRPAIGETLTDAFLLSAGMAPAVWFLVVRPLREMHRSRGELLRLVFEAQETERRRLGRDLHDELGQSLTALRVGLRGLASTPDAENVRERAGELADIAAGTLDSVRRLARDIRPDVLEDFGLRTAAERLVEDFRAAHGIDAALVAELPEQRLPGLVELAAYRVLQEALTNIARHANATRVEVILRVGTSDETLLLRVSDNGRGFVGELDVPSLGLQSMRERAELLSGSFRVVRSGIGGGPGATVEATLPFPRSEQLQQ